MNKYENITIKNKIIKMEQQTLDEFWQEADSLIRFYKKGGLGNGLSSHGRGIDMIVRKIMLSLNSSKTDISS